MKSGSEVDLSEVPGFEELIQDVIDSWLRVAVLNSKTIQGPLIYAQAQ